MTLKLRIAVCGFVLLLPALLAAGSSDARNDQFAPYHEAIDARLAQMLNRATEPQEPAVGNRAERVEQPAEPAAATVRAYANRYWGGREDDLKRALGRLGQIRPVLEGILESEGLPKSLVAVVLVESAADPLALSPKEARGLWQFIPATARQYGLTVDSRRDDRIQIEQATRAAARFLRDLYEQFQDWPLALAAYNAGKGAVERAVQKSGRDDFWSLSSKRLLPEETRNYVPAVLSAMQLFGHTLPTVVRTESYGISRSERVYAGTGVSN